VGEEAGGVAADVEDFFAAESFEHGQPAGDARAVDGIEDDASGLAEFADVYVEGEFDGRSDAFDVSLAGGGVFFDGADVGPGDGSGVGGLEAGDDLGGEVGGGCAGGRAVLVETLGEQALEPVPLLRVVAGGEDHSAGRVVLVGHDGDGGGHGDASVDDVDPRADEPGECGVVDHGGAGSAVASEDDGGLAAVALAEPGSEGSGESGDDLGGERIADDASAA